MNDGITFLGETTSLRENNEVWFANSKNQDWFEKQNCNPQQTLASYSSVYRYSKITQKSALIWGQILG